MRTNPKVELKFAVKRQMFGRDVISVLLKTVWKELDIKYLVILCVIHGKINQM